MAKSVITITVKELDIVYCVNVQTFVRLMNRLNINIAISTNNILLINVAKLHLLH